MLRAQHSVQCLAARCHGARSVFFNMALIIDGTVGTDLRRDESTLVNHDSDIRVVGK